MKRSKLFKRASSLVTALLVFSMCFAGMAYAAEGTITAEEATVTAVKDAEGLYEVTVSYEASVGSLGVTLLAFSQGKASDDAWAEATSKGKYTDDMQIVGIDQTENSGSITFVISTNSTDSINMAEGETGVILLGGDGVSTPSKTTFTVPSNESESKVWVAKELTYNGKLELGEIEIPEGATDDVKLAAVIAEAKKTDETFTYVSGTEPAEYATKKLKDLGENDIVDYSNPETTPEGVYKVKLTIAEGVLSEDGKAKTGAGLSIVVPVTVSFKTVTTPTVLYGDVNGDGKVNLADGRDLSRHLAKWPEYATLPNAAAADVNADGRVNLADGRDLSRHLAKWPEYATLPYTSK